jgi:hypothetical protein
MVWLAAAALSLGAGAGVALAANEAGSVAAAGQEGGLTLAQVESRYPRMSSVHIEKCDKNGNGIYTKTEMLCVQSIYNVMYLQR